MNRQDIYSRHSRRKISRRRDERVVRAAVSEIEMLEQRQLLSVSPTPATYSPPQYIQVPIGSISTTAAAQQTSGILTHLTIIPTFDSSITSDTTHAAGIESTINNLISIYENEFSTPITVNITFQETNSGLGGSSTFIGSVPYTDVRAALVANATTADDALALANTPLQTNNPVDNNANITVTTANARALGFNASVPTDSTISLNTSICNFTGVPFSPAKYDLMSVAEHEVDEALGSGSGLSTDPNFPTTVSIEDLYRYDQNGARGFNTNSGSQAFFSIDGGVTDLGQYNQNASGDFGDWFSASGGVVPQVQDAFGSPGSSPTLGMELERFDIRGYTPITSVATDVAVTDSTSNVTAGSQVVYAVTVTNNGTSVANDVQLNELIPSNGTFASATETAGDPAFNLDSTQLAITHKVVATIPTLASGATAHLFFTVNTSGGLAVGTALKDGVEVVSSTVDPNVVNNIVSATSTIVAANPAPILTSINPNSAPQNSPATPITLTGSGFVSGSVADFNGTPIVTTFTSGTSLSATIPAADLTSLGTDTITVVSPAPGGGTSLGQTFTVTAAVVNPLPTLASINPTDVFTDSPDTTITLTGTGFVASSTADYNGTPLATTFVSSTSLTAVVPAADLVFGSPHTPTITVVSPGPGGGTSNGQNLFVDIPSPSITNLNPSSALVNSPDTTITVTGSSFEPTTTVNFDGSPISTTYVSHTSLTVIVPAADLTLVGSHTIQAITPNEEFGPGNNVEFDVLANPAPTLTSISPNSTPVNSPATTITLTGIGFDNNSVADFNGVAIATTFVSPTSLTAVIPAADLTTVGPEPVTVVNPAPGGGTSLSQNFTVTSIAQPTFKNLSAPTIFLHTKTTVLSGKLNAGAGSVPVGDTVAITLHGVTQTAVIKANGTFSATFSTQSLKVGSYDINYAFAGDASFAPVTADETLDVTYKILLVSPVPSGPHKQSTFEGFSVVLADVNNQVVDASVKLSATGIAKAAHPNNIMPIPPGSSPGGLFTGMGIYSFTLKTASLAKGNYLLYFVVSGDPVTHSIAFTV